MRILAVDPSLTGTGICLGDTHPTDPSAPYVCTIKPPAKLDSIQRLRFIRDVVADYIRDGISHPVDLIVMEGPAYGTQGSKGQSGHHERAGLWWMLREAYDLRDIPVAIVTPTSLKMYATGKGNAPKDDVLIQAVRRLPIQLMNNNEADSATMWCMAADHYGMPLVQMPQEHRRGLEKIQWPTL